MKRRILGITGAVSLLLFFVFWLVTGHMAESLLDQNMAKRWSADGNTAQISCFFSSDAAVTEDTLLEFEYNLRNYLQEASITVESENPGARLWTTACSAEGKIMLVTDYGKVEADALGVGGDFFLFHPYQLLNGAYFSGNDVNQDYCVIDEDASWQLFGSNDVAGMTVYIGGVPHIVTGVIKRPSGHLWEKAGLDTTRVFVSLSSLEKYGSSHGITHYEILMPNPVKNFALDYVKEKLGTEEKESEILENGSRFGIVNRFKIIRDFGTRSMSGKSIVYPFWENVARGYEDIIGLLTVFMMLTFAYPFMIVFVWLILYWKRKNWTFKGIWIKIVERLEVLMIYLHKWKHEKEEEESL